MEHVTGFAFHLSNENRGMARTCIRYTKYCLDASDLLSILNTAKEMKLGLEMDYYSELLETCFKFNLLYLF